MEAKTVRSIKSGTQYDKLFPAPAHNDPILLQDATVMDTVKMVKKVVKKTLGDTARIAKLLEGKTLNETCANIWHFVYEHIRYTRDKAGTEQVRRPARTWHDRKAGVDCDCYSTFISSILTNLKIAHTLRITEYGSKGYFQHIYPIVPRSNQTLLPSAPRDAYLVLDCVKDAYNDEEPFTNHKDFTMDLQYLDGLGESDYSRTNTTMVGFGGGSSTAGILGLEDYIIDGLGKVRRRRGSKVEVQTINPNVPQATSPLVAPSLATAMIPAVISLNQGVLKDGRQIRLSDENVAGSAWVNPYGGSAQGKTFYNKKLLINGVWDGKTTLMRCIVKDGILRGVNTLGHYFADYSNGRGVIRINGVMIQNPGMDLAGNPNNGAYGAYSAENNAYTLNALYAINGLGEVSSTAVPSRMGMFIPYSVLLSLWQQRKGNGGSSSGTGGLEEIAGLLGETGMATLETQVMGLGDFEANGLDDINSIAGDGDLDIQGIEGLEGLADYLNSSAYNGQSSSIAVIDGLGRTRKVSVRGKRNNTAEPAASTLAVSTEKKLGLYVPLNTLRNLFKLRASNLTRLQANGHQVNNGEVSNTVDGMAFGNVLQTGYDTTDGLGWGFFNNLVKGVSDTISKVAPVASFIPGVSPFAAVAKIGSGVLQRITNGNGGGGQSNAAQAQPQDYATKYSGESADAYNRSMMNGGSATDGLSGIAVVDNMVGFVKSNPVVSIAGAGALGYGIYHFWPKKWGSTSRSGKGVSGTKTKSKAKSKSKAKPKSKGKVQHFQMKGMS